MSKNVKVRNMRNEYRYSFMWDLLVLSMVLLLGEFLLPKSGPIGTRSMLTLYVIDGGLTLFFMYIMEKYSITISGLYEKAVINILSNIYTLVIISFINLIFFTSLNKFVIDVYLAVGKVVALFVTDFILEKIRNNPKIRSNPKLLILGSSSKNFNRMKRIKYGVLKNYESWYESIEGMSLEEVEAFVDEQFVKYDAICVLDGLSEEEYSIAVKKTMELNIDLFVVPKLIDVGKTNAKLVRFDDVLTLYMPKKTLSDIEKFLKRTIDIVLSFIGLVIAAIPMALIALVIKITSPGPIFYCQSRLTKDKKEFGIYKFRTMIPDAEKLSGPKFAEKDDPRITPIGKILRACRLDELPQILNILKGDMSIVGPRPERGVFVEQFEKEIENYDYRFEVKAGLTSLSHVYGRYSTYIHDRTYYDLFYITHYSLFMDFKIILLTSKIMFLKSAAEGEDDFKEKTIANTEKEAKAVEK
ncbi:MAG: exopolysaccharide biosynthesis polyprenyl glycosylphosphotransferase [Clostridia bacterium]|nr:exopolysaccharide biosynthesis polyprenyl glycosylphosphotransferase [Clostridia bacterium]